jgi:hypothetical protein
VELAAIPLLEIKMLIPAAAPAVAVSENVVAVLLYRDELSI